MSVFEGYLFEIERSNTNQYKIRHIHWFDSSKNTSIGNDGHIIMISEPIKNFDGKMKDTVISSHKTKDYFLSYENGIWILNL
jgi:hypothetical protein